MDYFYSLALLVMRRGFYVQTVTTQVIWNHTNLD